MKVFRKEKMLARVKAEGLEGMLDDETMAIMNGLDGKEVFPNLWRQTVYGEEDAHYCVLNGEQLPVNIHDCEDV